MQSEELIKQLGFSIKSESLQQLMVGFELESITEDNLDFKGNKYWVKSRNKAGDIILTFDGYNRYVQQYGLPHMIKNVEEDELILTEIDFDNEYGNLGIPFSIPLPFGLIQGDSKEEVITKLGKKPKEKSSTSYGFAWWFYMDDYRVLTALNKNYAFIWLRIMKLDKSELSKIALKKELSSQRKNINPENEKLVLSFKNKLPTIQWKQRMKQGDDLLTRVNIKAIEDILLNFVQQLSVYTSAKKASNIFNSIKKVVKEINKTNNQNDHFIETLEREELCEFIDKVINSTGFKIKDDVDLTEEWREW